MGGFPSPPPGDPPRDTQQTPQGHHRRQYRGLNGGLLWGQSGRSYTKQFWKAPLAFTYVDLLCQTTIQTTLKDSRLREVKTKWAREQHAGQDSRPIILEPVARGGAEITQVKPIIDPESSQILWGTCGDPPGGTPPRGIPPGDPPQATQKQATIRVCSECAPRICPILTQNPPPGNPPKPSACIKRI